MSSFWDGRRVLVTGHTGFKGAWLALWLQRKGAAVTGFALPPDDERSAFPALAPWPGLTSVMGDVRDPAAVAAVLGRSDPEVVFHLAAQALVRRGYADAFETYHTNVVGTANVLHQLAAAPSVRAVVVVTSDKVYAQIGAARAFVEDDVLGGHDPYSASKALTELLVAGWRSRAGEDGRRPAVSTARAGNVIGGGDRGPDRLLPDAWRALEAGTPLVLRYPAATRPWQFVLDPLQGYLRLAECLVDQPAGVPAAVNFGPGGGGAPTVREVAQRVFELWGSGSVEVGPASTLHEAPTLSLDAGLARRALGWAPRLDLDTALEWTLAWWRGADRGEDLRALATGQIEAYEGIRRGVPAARA